MAAQAAGTAALPVTIWFQHQLQLLLLNAVMQDDSPVTSVMIARALLADPAAAAASATPAATAAAVTDPTPAPG